jgi:hypothetical protein
MKFREPTKLHRKSGMWGTRRLVTGLEPKARGLSSHADSLPPAMVTKEIFFASRRRPKTVLL